MSNSNEAKSEEEVTMTPLFQPWKIFFWETFLFSLTLGLGIAAAFKINKILEIQKFTLSQIPFWKFIIAFLLATLFIFLIIRFLKFRKEKGTIFKILFVLAVSLGGLLFLETWLPEPFPLIIVVTLIFWWWKRPTILNQDVLMILGLAGVGSTLGLALQPLIVLFLLIIFSIYDFIAVYKTKHMIKMAKEMIEAGAILGLIVPQEISDFLADLKKIKPGGKFLILGGGDIAFPLLFCASLIPVGISHSLIVGFFVLIGLFISFWFFISQKIRQPIPALPPIALFSIIGYLITKLIYG